MAGLFLRTTRIDRSEINVGGHKLPKKAPIGSQLIGAFFDLQEMKMHNNTILEDLNVLSEERLMTPAELKKLVPISEAGMETVANGRSTIKRILERTDPRLFLVVGPCSIHDSEAALVYAKRLQVLA